LGPHCDFGAHRGNGRPHCDAILVVAAEDELRVCTVSVSVPVHVAREIPLYILPVLTLLLVEYRTFGHHTFQGTVGITNRPLKSHKYQRNRINEIRTSQ
jgi:hypothetical protein